MFECKDCGANIEVPFDFQSDEIIGCEDCGLDYILEQDTSGLILIKELTIEGEDWGE